MTSILFLLERTLRNQFRWSYLRNKNFSELFSAFLNSRLICENFETNMIFIAYVFPKLQTANNLVRQMFKRCCFRRPFDKQDGERFQTLLKSAQQHLYHFYWSMSKKITLKKSLLLIYKMFGLFVNTSTADDKYSLLNSDNLTQPIKMQLSRKRKTFS